MKRTLIAVLAGLCAVAVTLLLSPGGRAQSRTIRLELFVLERNAAVDNAIRGKRPSQWDTAVRDLLFAGKARWSTCPEARVRFGHMDTVIPEGPVSVVYVRPSSNLSAQSPITGRSTAHFTRIPDPAKPGNFWQELVVPLQNGNALVYLPMSPFTGSENPVGEAWVPGAAKIYGLPQGNVSGHLITTPRNDGFGAQNDWHKAARRTPYHNHSMFLVVEPGACG